MAAEFTRDEVLDLRDKYKRGMLDVRDAANYYRVSPETIRRAARGDTYREVGGFEEKPADRRYARVREEVKTNGAVVGNAVQTSLGKLQELLAQPVKQQTEADYTRRSMPADPFLTGGIDDPGEDKVLE